MRERKSSNDRPWTNRLLAILQALTSLLVCRWSAVLSCLCLLLKFTCSCNISLHRWVPKDRQSERKHATERLAGTMANTGQPSQWIRILSTCIFAGTNICTNMLSRRHVCRYLYCMPLRHRALRSIRHLLVIACIALMSLLLLSIYLINYHDNKSSIKEGAKEKESKYRHWNKFDVQASAETHPINWAFE